MAPRIRTCLTGLFVFWLTAIAALPASEAGSQSAPGASATSLFSLYHHGPRKERGRPIILAVPGVGFNERLFDLAKEVSLTATLTSKDYPVYLLAPHWRQLEPQGQPGLLRLVQDVLPAAVAQVRSQEPGRQIILLGHGTGATLVAGYLEAQPTAGISGAVLIAPVLSLRFPDRALKHLARQTIPDDASAIDPGVLLSVRNPFPAGGDYFGLLLTSHNDDAAEALRKRTGPAFSPVPGFLAKELLEWVKSGCCAVRDRDFFRELPRIRVPVLLISGIADNIARREDVERAAQYIGSDDREYRMMSRTNFYGRDYGHLDLVATPEAVREVFPVITRWLSGKRSGRVFPSHPPSLESGHVEPTDVLPTELPAPQAPPQSHVVSE